MAPFHNARRICEVVIASSGSLSSVLLPPLPGRPPSALPRRVFALLAGCRSNRMHILCAPTPPAAEENILRPHPAVCALGTRLSGAHIGIMTMRDAQLLSSLSSRATHMPDAIEPLRPLHGGLPVAAAGSGSWLCALAVEAA